jgi:hypothetical protein
VVVKLTLRRDGDDWFLIEKAEHEHEQRNVRNQEGGSSWWSSAWITDAGIEGDAEEMAEIAKAVEKGSRVSFKRCAVECRDNEVEFWSPKNSRNMGFDNPPRGIVSKEEAKELAKEIREKLAGTWGVGT